MKLTNDQIMAYLDGTLSSDERAGVESHLDAHQEEAEMVRSLQFAAAATQDLRENDNFRVSDDFWPRVRDQLGPAPKRSAWRQLTRGLAGVLSPVRVPRYSLGVAIAAIVIGMGAFLFAPQDAINHTTASQITAADMDFIQSSVVRHQAYVAAEPVVPGDASVRETGAEEEDEYVR